MTSGGRDVGWFGRVFAGRFFHVFDASVLSSAATQTVSTPYLINDCHEFPYSRVLTLNSTLLVQCVRGRSILNFYLSKKLNVYLHLTNKTFEKINTNNNKYAQTNS